jgi:hypothetical protein
MTARGEERCLKTRLTQTAVVQNLLIFRLCSGDGDIYNGCGG